MERNRKRCLSQSKHVFHTTTVKSRNYESRNNAMSRKYNGIIYDFLMEASIEKSRYNDKSRCYTGFNADCGLS